MKIKLQKTIKKRFVVIRVTDVCGKNSEYYQRVKDKIGLPFYIVEDKYMSNSLFKEYKTLYLKKEFIDFDKCYEYLKSLIRSEYGHIKKDTNKEIFPRN